MPYGFHYKDLVYIQRTVFCTLYVCNEVCNEQVHICSTCQHDKVHVRVYYEHVDTDHWLQCGMGH